MFVYGQPTDMRKSVRENRELRDQVAALKHQLDRFKRQLFGTKSERFVPEVNPQQLHLGEALPIPDATPEQRQRVPAHTRRVAKTDLAQDEPSQPFFDETKVPVETVTLPSPEAEALLVSREDAAKLLQPRAPGDHQAAE